MVYLRKNTRKGHDYYSIVKSVRINGKPRQKILLYLGRLDFMDEERLLKIQKCLSGKMSISDILKPEILKELSISEVKSYGDVITLKSIVDMLRLQEIVNHHSSKSAGVDLGKLVCILAINRCVDPQSKHKVPDWYEKTALPEAFELSPKDLRGQNLYRALDYFEEEVSLKIQEDLVRKLDSLFGIDFSTLFYDITSTFFYGVNVGAFGYSRDKRGDKKQINIGVVVSNNKLPIAHWIFNGNVPDVKTLNQITPYLKAKYGTESFVLVLDRGMPSSENIEQMDQEEMDYILGLKKNKTEKNLILKAHEFDFWNLQDGREDMSAMEVPIDENGHNKKIMVFYDKKLAKEQRKTRSERLEECKDELKKVGKNLNRYKSKDNIIVKIDNLLKKFKAKSYMEYQLKETEEGLRLDYSVNSKLLGEREKLDGKYCILCSKPEMSPETVINQYRAKDKIEKVFRTLKSVLEMHPLRHWKEVRVKAQVFVCVIAYLLEAVLELILMNSGKKITSEKYLDILKDIRLVNMSSIHEKKDVVTMMTTVTHEQKEIISLLEIEDLFREESLLHFGV